jgi:hypothetical protein
MMNLNRKLKLLGTIRFILYIKGAITLPEGVDWEDFFDELLLWLEDKGAFFFGGTEKVEDKVEAVYRILKETTGLEMANKDD